jgi:hypothetical protein
MNDETIKFMCYYTKCFGLKHRERIVNVPEICVQHSGYLRKAIDKTYKLWQLKGKEDFLATFLSSLGCDFPEVESMLHIIKTAEKPKKLPQIECSPSELKVLEAICITHSLPDIDSNPKLNPDKRFLSPDEMMQFFQLPSNWPIAQNTDEIYRLIRMREQIEQQEREKLYEEF